MTKRKIQPEQLARERLDALGIPPQDQEVLLAQGKLIQLSRKDLYSQPGAKTPPLAIVLQGKLFSYHLTENFDARTHRYYTPRLRGVVCDLPTLLRGKPSELFVEALTSVILLTIPHNTFQTLLSQSSAFKDWYIRMLEEFALRAHVFQLSQQERTYEGKVRTLYHYFPDAFEEIPLKHLAEILGINRNTLASILKETIAQSHSETSQ